LSLLIAKKKIVEAENNTPKLLDRLKCEFEVKQWKNKELKQAP
jgi:hypothetical protein